MDRKFSRCVIYSHHIVVFFREQVYDQILSQIDKD